MRLHSFLVILSLIFAISFGAELYAVTDNAEAITSDPNVIFAENFEARATGVSDLGRATNFNSGWQLSSNTGSVINTEYVDGGKCLQFFYAACPRAGDNGGGGFMSSNLK